MKMDWVWSQRAISITVVAVLFGTACGDDAVEEPETEIDDAGGAEDTEAGASADQDASSSTEEDGGVDTEDTDLVTTQSTDGGVILIPTADGGDAGTADGGPMPTLSIGGQLRISDRVFLDVDVKNADTLPGSNDEIDVEDPDADQSQEITSPSTLVGYLGPEVVTDGDDPRPDFVDYYKVQLEAGQAVTLVIAEPAEQGATAADLDLYLLDAAHADISDGGEWVADSMGVGDKELVVAPKTDTYWIAVERYAGDEEDAALGATYSLSVGIRPTAETLEEIASTSMSSEDVVPGEALVESAAGSLRWHGTGSSALANLGQSGAFQRVQLDLPVATKARSGDVSLKDRRATVYAIKELHKRPDVRRAVPNYLYHHMAVPNDPLYGDQWHYDQIDLEQAWENTDRIPGSSRGEGVIVAVIDTGVVLQHPDFINADGTSQFVAGKDLISFYGQTENGRERPDLAADGDGYDDDPNDPGDGRTPGDHSFHGTHCAGTVAAATDNAEGGAGVAPLAKIMPIRAMGRGGGISTDIAEAIKWAAGVENATGTVPDQPAHIISMSLGGPRSPVFQEAIDLARAAGVIVIAAAGNETSPVELVSPAAEDGVVAVSATNFNRELAFYSNFGTAVDLAAPGGDTTADGNLDGLGDGVISTVWKNNGQTRYVAYQGTSMATPHVAGVAALMKSIWRDMGPEQFDQILTSGEITVDIGEDGKDTQFGYGLINANRAVLVAAREAGVDGELAPDPVLSVSTTVLDFGGGDTNVLPLVIGNTGEGDLEITNVVPSTSWLSVAPGEVGENAVTVDRDDDTLSEGVNSATLLIESNGGSVTVDVRVYQGVEPDGGDIDIVYVILVDPKNGKSRHQEVAFRSEEGFLEDYGFLFEEVPPGKYYLVAGTDVADTLYLGNDGDFYGAFPLAQDPLQLCVMQDPDEPGCREFISEDRENADFNLQVLMDQGARVEDDTEVDAGGVDLDGGVGTMSFGSIQVARVRRLY